ncbi:MAG: hypothetical protein ACTSV5_07755 [Promethearchaeota archaeon]
MDLNKMKIIDENLEKIIETLDIKFSEEDLGQLSQHLTDNDNELLNEMEQNLKMDQNLNMEHIDLKMLKDQVGEGAILKVLMQFQNNPLLRQKLQDIIMKKIS